MSEPAPIWRLTTAVSTLPDGTTFGNASSFGQTLTPDGTKVVFFSHATNLAAVSSGTSGTNLLVKDLASGAVTALTTDGAAFGVPTGISSDSQYVVVTDPSTGSGGSTFRRRIDGTGTPVRVDISQSGVLPNQPSQFPEVSPANPDLVVFLSNATNLIDGTTVNPNGATQIYLKNLATGAVRLVSSRTDGVTASYGGVYSPAITQYAGQDLVAFEVGGAVDFNGSYDPYGSVWVKNLATGAITEVDSSSSGVRSNNFSGYNRGFAPDGHRLIFSSKGSNLVSGTISGRLNVFIKDVVTGTLVQASVTATGGQANQDCQNGYFLDNSHVVFESTATNLVAGVADGLDHLYIKDLTSGALSVVTSSDGITPLAVPSGPGSFYPGPTTRSFTIAGPAQQTWTNNPGTGTDIHLIRLADAVAISANTPARYAGPSGTTTFTFTVSRSGDISEALGVNWAVAGSGASPADSTDFGGSLPSGTVSFAANQTTATIAVAVSGDPSVEPNEQFQVTLSNPTGNGLIATSAAAATIVGSPLVLTTGTDTVVGPSTADIILGTAATLTSGDTVQGGSGSDTLSLSGGGAYRLDQAGLFANIAEIDLNGGSLSVTPSQLAGVTVIRGTGSETMDLTGTGGSLDFSAVPLFSGVPVIHNHASSGASAIRLPNSQSVAYVGFDSGNDCVTAGNIATTIFGGAGSSLLMAGAGGGQVVIGGQGLDTLLGGSGATTVFGSDSSYFASAQAKSIVGAASGSVLIGRTNGTVGGIDTITSSAGAETLFGGTADALLTDAASGTGAGPTVLVGGSGNNTIIGGNALGSADTLFGGAGTGSNFLTAGSGASQTLVGGAFLSTLRASASQDDMLFAGSGTNTFLIANRALGGTVTIVGFQSGRDHIDLTSVDAALGFTTVTAATAVGAAATSSFSNGYRIQLPGGSNGVQTITVIGPTHFNAGDFTF